MLKYFLVLTTSLCLYANLSFGQLDSVAVSVEFITNSSTDTLIPSETMKINIWVNDADDVGRVLVNVYDEPSNQPMAMVVLNRQELLAENYISGNVVSFPVGFLSSSGEYKVVVQLLTEQLAYLSPVQINYP